jgi:hypothetical protein
MPEPVAVTPAPAVEPLRDESAAIIDQLRDENLNLRIDNRGKEQAINFITAQARERITASRHELPARRCRDAPRWRRRRCMTTRRAIARQSPSTRSRRSQRRRSHHQHPRRRQSHPNRSVPFSGVGSSRAGEGDNAPKAGGPPPTMAAWNMPAASRSATSGEGFAYRDSRRARHTRMPILGSCPLDFGDGRVIHRFPLDSSDVQSGLW